MTFQENASNTVVRIAAKVGDTFGSVSGYLSARMLNDSVPQKLRSTVADAVGRVDAALNAIDARSVVIVRNAASEFKHMPGKALHAIGEMTKQASETFNLSIEKGTYYVIDFAGVVKASFAELRK